MSIADKLTQIAENEQKVYDSGYSKGKQDNHDEFWDYVQQKGTRSSYSYAFQSSSWNDKTFKPKYDIKVNEYGNNFNDVFEESTITNLKQILEEQNVYIDISLYTGSNGMGGTFRSCANMTHIGRIIYPENLARYSYTFHNCKALHTIDEIHFSPDGSTVFANSETIFQNCNSLENITITGVIGRNGFNVQWSTKLSKDSIISIINALSTETTGLTVTLSATAVNSAFGGNTSTEWLNLISTKPNWIISLV